MLPLRLITPADGLVTCSEDVDGLHFEDIVNIYMGNPVINHKIKNPPFIDTLQACFYFNHEGNKP